MAVDDPRCCADDLWLKLGELGIQQGSGREGVHPTFGNVEERIKHMVTKRCVPTLIQLISEP